jgi:hypothetical protein
VLERQPGEERRRQCPVEGVACGGRIHGADREGWEMPDLTLTHQQGSKGAESDEHGLTALAQQLLAGPLRRVQVCHRDAREPRGLGLIRGNDVGQGENALRQRTSRCGVENRRHPCLQPTA